MSRPDQPDWTAPALRAEIESFLHAHHTFTLATVADDGSAHAASLLYALEGLALVWTSDPATRHSLHLASRRQVSATVAPDYNDFSAIRGVQIAGEAVRLEGAAELHARALMAVRYPFLRLLAESPAALLAAWRKAAFYRLEPSRLTLIDNTRGFGHKATLLIGPGGEVALAPRA
jgi:uncharacterized protein YhbP (UPF0306 family)